MEPTDKKSVATLIEALQVDGYRLKKSQLSSLCGHRFEATHDQHESASVHMVDVRWILHESIVQNVIEQARQSTKLSHPLIKHALSMHKNEHGFFVITPSFDGVDLHTLNAHILQSKTAWPSSLAIWLIFQVNKMIQSIVTEVSQRFHHIPHTTRWECCRDGLASRSERGAWYESKYLGAL